MFMAPTGGNVQAWSLVDYSAPNLCLGASDSSITVTTNNSVHTISNARQWAIRAYVLAYGGIKVVS